MKKLSLSEKLKAELKKQNAAFTKMTRTEKRIAIAQDVILALKKDRYYASPGTYCDLVFNHGKDLVEGKVELQTLLHDGVVQQCDVCAIGSLFMSKVFLGNKFKVKVGEDYDGDTELKEGIGDRGIATKALKGIFTVRELKYIEYCFEGCDISDTFTNENKKFHEKVKNFYSQYYSNYSPSEDRMIGIMENIIKNKGKFIL